MVNKLHFKHYTIILFMGLFFGFTACKKDRAITMTDADGNVYKTVKIGNQIWMAENLKTTKYRDGTPIPNVADAVDWFNLVSGAYCVKPGVADYAETYGKIYNWYAVNDSRNLAPEGWHVATKADWDELMATLGGTDAAGGKLKEAGTAHWLSPNTGATNSSGFTALPAGYKAGIVQDGFYSFGGIASFWTSTEANGNGAVDFVLSKDDATLEEFTSAKYGGHSVRCVKDK